ncbi:uncharacterized protein LOC144744617 [Ciona intestinalis]
MELTEHDFIQDEVDDMEEMVANMFKQFCDSGGKEREGTKLKAAPMLSMLAKIYELKTNHKKLNMTRSAALYNAAIVRDPQNQRFKDELKTLCSAVLVKPNAANRDADLISLAAEVKEELAELREDFGKSFNRLKEIPDGLEDDQLIILQRRKVIDVKNIQNEVTRRYTELMRFISDKCIEIMGVPPGPPCKYAVVGLGSLARSEITPYSDFEHIIVLENVAKMEDQEMIMKYFRWFTTIFNIILINLGETMINCVAIPSINPRYRDWFTDIVTLNGVTFDGMVAHACIRPLGRPATKKKEKTEFIKPVDEMIKYLDSDKDKNQGYHVAGALSKACFVAGDEAICVEYKKRAHQRIKKNDEKNKFMTVFEQIEENLQNFDLANIHFSTFLGLQNYNMKRAIYRGATIFISAIGRLCSLQASSCFDIIDELKEKGKCSEEMADRLRFMVAVACEVRAKVYHSKGQQDDDYVSVGEELKFGLIKIVGKQSLVSFTMSVLFMQQSLKEYKADYRTWTSEWFVMADPVRLKIKSLTILGLYKDVVELAKQTTSSSQVYAMPMNIIVVRVAFECKEYDLVIKMCSNINRFNLTVDQKFAYKVFELASIVKRSYNKETKSFKGSTPEVEAKIQILEEMSENVGPSGILLYSLTTYSEALLLLNDGRFSNIHTLWKKLLKSKDLTYDIKTTQLFVYAQILVENRKPTEGFKLLDEAKQLIQTYKNTTTVVNMLLYDSYAICYSYTSRFYEALICRLEFGRIWKKLKLPIPDAIKQGMKNAFHRFIFHHPMKLCKSAETLINNGKPTELKLLDEAKQLMQPYKNTTTVAHMLLYGAYAVCYYNTNRYYEALICGLECARICKKLKQPIPDDNKQGVKKTFQLFIFCHSMKLCKSAATLTENGKPTEGLKLLDEVKQMMKPYKNTTTVVHMLLYGAYAVCYHNTDRYIEALICWLEYARIGNELKQPIPDVIKQWIKDTFHQFLFHRSMKLCLSAETLMDNGKYTEALKLLGEAKQLMQPYKITTTLAHRRLYSVYAVCYRNTGRYYEALICWLEYARIYNELEKPIPDVIKQGIRKCFYLLKFQHYWFINMF